MIKKLLKHILNLYKRTNHLKAYKDFVQIAEECVTDNLEIEIRKPIRGNIYLKISKGSIVSGKFVFEAETSQILIGENSFIGGGLFICHDKIEIGSNVMISWGCTIIDNNAHSLKASERIDDVKNWKRGITENQPWKYKDWSNVRKAGVHIADNSWIGFNSIILKGVHIGAGAIVGAGSVVTKNVLQESSVAGNPAKEINRID
ncbi:MAG TPA: acyltransferase [Bacteroidia bacterium]|nr:acyltransferase [Bacteroidia bacterium]